LEGAYLSSREARTELNVLTYASKIGEKGDDGAGSKYVTEKSGEVNGAKGGNEFHETVGIGFGNILTLHISSILSNSGFILHRIYYIKKFKRSRKIYNIKTKLKDWTSADVRRAVFLRQ